MTAPMWTYAPDSTGGTYITYQTLVTFPERAILCYLLAEESEAGE